MKNKDTVREYGWKIRIQLRSMSGKKDMVIEYDWKKRTWLLSMTGEQGHGY